MSISHTILELQYQHLPRDRWQSLSYATTHTHSMWQLFGWATVLGSGSWRWNEEEVMPTFADLMKSMKKHAAKTDAPALLDELEEKGVIVWADGDILRTKGQFDDATKARIKELKPALMELLKEVPAWSDEECLVLEQKVKDAHNLVREWLHPTPGSFNDDCYAQAARNIFADVSGSISRAKSVRRIDHMRRRVDWLLTWLATLDKRIIDMRDLRHEEWSKNRKTLSYKDFEGKRVKEVENA